jgi:hypothetical protein
MVIEPGLIRIAMDYGWMRAADTLDVTDDKRRYAEELSDKITFLRSQNWLLAHDASGMRRPDHTRGFSYFVFRGLKPPSQLRPVRDPQAVDTIRANCRAIRDAIYQRILINAPTLTSAIRTAWFTQWEMISLPPNNTGPWDVYVWSGGRRPAGTPPSPI